MNGQSARVLHYLSFNERRNLYIQSHGHASAFINASCLAQRQAHNPWHETPDTLHALEISHKF